MTKPVVKIYSKTIFSAFLLIVSIAVLSQTNFAQSTDPDKPTALTKGIINGSSSGGLSDEKTYYYAFNVKRGKLTLTLDLIPANKSDAGGYLQWTMLNAKFAKLKEDVLTAQGSPERQVKDLPVTVKRRIILKIVVSGNANYKIKLEGSAAGFGGQ